MPSKELFKAIKTNNLVRVKKIIDSSPDQDLLSSSPDNENALFLACRHGYLKIVKYILTKDSTLLLDRTENNENALTLALGSKNLDLVKHLVEECREEPHPQIFSSEENEAFVRAALQSAHLPTITYLLEKFPFLCGYLPKLLPEAENIPELKAHLSHLYYLHGNYLVNQSTEQWWKGDAHFRTAGLRPTFEAALVQYNLAIEEDKDKETPKADYYVARMNLRLKIIGLSNDTPCDNAFKSIANDSGVIFEPNTTLDADTCVTLMLAIIHQKDFETAQELLDEAFKHHPNKGMLLYLEFYLAVKTNRQEKSKQWIFEKARGHQVLPLIKEFYLMISCFPWLISDIFHHDELNLETKDEFTKLLGTYPSPYPKSLLHMACELKDERLATTLLSLDVGYIECKKYKNSPLEHAATLRYVDMAKLICDYGCYTRVSFEKALAITLEGDTTEDHKIRVHLLGAAIKDQSFVFTPPRLTQIKEMPVNQPIEQSSPVTTSTAPALETTLVSANSPSVDAALTTIAERPTPPSLSDIMTRFLSPFDKKEQFANLAFLLKTLLELTPSLIGTIKAKIDETPPENRDKQFVITLFNEVLNVLQKFALDKKWIAVNQDLSATFLTFVQTFLTYYQDDIKMGLHSLLIHFEDFAVNRGWIARDNAMFKHIVTLLNSVMGETNDTAKSSMTEEKFWADYGEKHVPKEAHYPLRIATGFFSLAPQLKSAQVAAFSVTGPGCEQIKNWKTHVIAAIKLLVTRLHYPTTLIPKETLAKMLEDTNWNEIFTQNAICYPHFKEDRLSLYIPLFRAALCVGEQHHLPEVIHVSQCLLHTLEGFHITLTDLSALPEKILMALEAGLMVNSENNPNVCLGLWGMMFGFLGLESWLTTALDQDRLIRIVALCRRLEKNTALMPNAHDRLKTLIKTGAQAMQWLYVAKSRLSFELPDVAHFDMTQACRLVANVLQGGVCLGIAQEEPTWILLGETVRAFFTAFESYEQTTLSLESIAPKISQALSLALKEIEQDVLFLSDEKKEALHQGGLYLALTYSSTIADKGKQLMDYSGKLMQLWQQIDIIKSYVPDDVFSTTEIQSAFTQLLSGDNRAINAILPCLKKLDSFNEASTRFSDLMETLDGLLGKAINFFTNLGSGTGSGVSLPAIPDPLGLVMNGLNLAVGVANICVTVHYNKKILARFDTFEGNALKQHQEIIALLVAQKVTLSQLEKSVDEINALLMRMEIQQQVNQQALVVRMDGMEDTLIRAIHEFRRTYITTELSKRKGKFQDKLTDLDFDSRTTFSPTPKNIRLKLKMFHRLLNPGDNLSSVNNPFHNGLFFYDTLINKKDFFYCILNHESHWIQPAGMAAYARGRRPLEDEQTPPNYPATIQILGLLIQWMEKYPKIEQFINDPEQHTLKQKLVNDFQSLLSSLEAFHQQLRNKEIFERLFDDWLYKTPVRSTAAADQDPSSTEQLPTCPERITAPADQRTATTDELPTYPERIAAFLAIRTLSYYAGLPHMIDSTPEKMAPWTIPDSDPYALAQARKYVISIKEAWMDQFDKGLPAFCHPDLDTVRRSVVDVLRRCLITPSLEISFAPLIENRSTQPSPPLLPKSMAATLQATLEGQVSLPTTRVTAPTVKADAADMKKVAATPTKKVNAAVTATKTTSSSTSSSTLTPSKVTPKKKSFALTLGEKTNPLHRDHLNSESDHKGRRDIHHLAKKGLLEKLEKMDSSHIISDNHGRTPVYIAMTHHQDTFVEKALSLNPDLIWLRDHHGKTPAFRRGQNHITGTRLFTSGPSYRRFFNMNDRIRLNMPTLALHPHWSPELLHCEYLARDLIHLSELQPGAMVIFSNNTRHRVIDLSIENGWRIFCLNPLSESTAAPLHVICYTTNSEEHFDQRLFKKAIDRCHRRAWCLDYVAQQLQENYSGRKLHFSGSGVGGLVAQYLTGYSLLRDKKIAVDTTLTTFHAPGVTADFNQALILHTRHTASSLSATYVFDPHALVHELGGVNLCLSATVDTTSTVKTKVIQIHDTQSSSVLNATTTAQKRRLQQQCRYERRLWASDKNVRPKETDTARSGLIAQQGTPCVVTYLSPDERKLKIQTDLAPFIRSLTFVKNHHRWTPFLPFIYGEALGHYLAYEPLEEDDCIPLPNLEGQEEPHQCFQIHQAKGLKIYALCPDATTNNQEMKILIQGTDPSDLDTVNRDLDRGSPGHRAFMNKVTVIIERLGELLTQFEKINSIRICGHSLGGALSQDMLTAIMGAKMRSYVCDTSFAEKEELLASIGLRGTALYHTCEFILTHVEPEHVHPFNRLTNVTLNAFNAPGASIAAISLCAGLKPLIATKDKTFKIEVYYQLVNKDVVHGAGKGYVLIRIPGVEGQVLYLEDSTWLDAHTRFWYKDIQEDTPLPKSSLKEARLWTGENVYPQPFMEFAALAPVKETIQAALTRIVPML